MYLRLTRGRFDPAHYDAVVPLVPAITAALRVVPGVQDVRIGIDRSSGRTLSLTSFDTLEQAQFSRDRIGPVLQPLRELGWEAEAPEIYEAME
jgi:hypothetical protein